ncbi:hypothetical protein NCCP2222_27600 [Sporosarcina sp. NCCP-2222]|uniref:sporulation histidine kinase inhibitor Sda n=1 Tax=Sporosarcina sp. NCCP-2222 TaxID=2935073 RepID=UPI00208405AB|nr:sporulation histidine kinase inhibitor Sda [Sporosarcina sp. NCCP-2222]GKV56813.1 hypothetical protein NCCP2222_27600 [Sporosarcina sp. NCCP-2222]
MSEMPDDLLLESYSKAKDLQLCRDFILLLEREIQRRHLHPVTQSPRENKSKKSFTI